jgi:hypothetical protein
MAVLVREHVRLRERPAPCAEAGPELGEEAEVDVDVLVDRTVERPTSVEAGPQPVSVDPVKKTVFAVT